MSENKERWSGAEIVSAAEPLDAGDLATLASIRELHDLGDPVPPGLVDRLKFAVALDEVLTEVAELTRLPSTASAVRSDTELTRTRTVTFSAEALTAMVTVHRLDSGALRVDGWLAPARAMTVRLRMDSGERQVVTEVSGRFSFDEVPDGFAQLIFAADGETVTVVTPLFEL